MLKYLKIVDRKEILEENLKKAFTVLHVQCTESILANLGVDCKYESIERDQDVIGMLKLITGVVFKLTINKEITNAM